MQQEIDETERERLLAALQAWRPTIESGHLFTAKKLRLLVDALIFVLEKEEEQPHDLDT